MILVNCCYCFVNCSFIYLGFPTELTRKHVSDLFMQRELELEARKPGANRLTTWKFFLDNDDEKFIEEVLEEAQSSLYSHSQSENCLDIGMYIYTWFLLFYQTIRHRQTLLCTLPWSLEKAKTLYLACLWIVTPYNILKGYQYQHHELS